MWLLYTGVSLGKTMWFLKWKFFQSGKPRLKSQLHCSVADGLWWHFLTCLGLHFVICNQRDIINTRSWIIKVCVYPWRDPLETLPSLAYSCSQKQVVGLSWHLQQVRLSAPAWIASAYPVLSVNILDVYSWSERHNMEGWGLFSAWLSLLIHFILNNFFTRMITLL